MEKERDLYQVSLKAILRNKNGKILILKNHEDSVFSGYWDLPGGRIESDEFDVPFSDILKREILEEAGILNVEINNVPVAISRRKASARGSLEKHKVHVLCVFFEAYVQSGDVKISEEHEGYEWKTLEDMNLEQYFTTGILEGLQMYLSMRMQEKFAES